MTVERRAPGARAFRAVSTLRTDGHGYFQVRVRTPQGALAETVVSAAELAASAAAAPTASPEDLFLWVELHRIRLAYAYDPYFAVSLSGVRGLPRQVEAVYRHLLPQPLLRFVLADDPGAGKTIMSGLFIRELMLRGDLDRCLVIAPGSLVEQWQEEMAERFGLGFDLLTRDQIEASITGNPFVEKTRLIVRLDMAARSDEVKAKWFEAFERLLSINASDMFDRDAGDGYGANGRSPSGTAGSRGQK